MIQFLTIAAGAALFLVGVVYVLPHVWRRLQERRLSDLCRKHSALVLSYDDGPGPMITPRVLSSLAEHEAHATFFALGRRAEKAPMVLDAVAEGGHEIGCHAYAHVNAWRAFPTRALFDLQRGYDSLSRWVRPSGTFRPPHGKLNIFSLFAILRRRIPVAWWTLDSGDTWASLPDIEGIVRQVVARRGGVVLMHDFDRASELEGPGARSDFVCSLTSALLTACARENIRVLSLQELRALEESTA